MKRILKLFICLTFVILLCGCGKKEAKEAKTIDSLLTSLSFNVKDTTNEMLDDDFEKIYVANNGKYNIDYYKLKSVDIAKEKYNSMKKYNIEKSDKNYKEENKENYDKFIQELSDKYVYLIRVDDTIIAAGDVRIEYKKDLLKTLKELNY